MARRADPDRSANHSRRRGDCSRPGIESLLIGTSDLSKPHHHRNLAQSR
jgi:hypothetical protein